MTLPKKSAAPRFDPAVWTPGFCLTLAQGSCTFCYGLGMRQGRNETMAPCNCVFRAIFRSCYAKFRDSISKEARIGRASLESNPSIERTRSRASFHWGMKNEEYTADFVLVSRRALSESQLQERVFTYHYLLGADWQLCCQRLKIDRGSFFHEVYRIQQILGRAYAELRPYRLFPTAEYFSTGCQTPEAAAEKKSASVWGRLTGW